jgi:S1-C subfamily serine protease
MRNRKKIIYFALSLLLVFSFGISQSARAQDLTLTRQELSALETYQNSLRKVSQKVLPVVVEINVVEIVKHRYLSLTFLGTPLSSSLEHLIRIQRNQGTSLKNESSAARDLDPESLCERMERPFM